MSGQGVNPLRTPEDKYGVRFTIPDKPVKEQLKMAKSIRTIMVNLAKATGETDGLDLSDVDAKIAELEKQVSAGVVGSQNPTHNREEKP